MIAEIRQIFDVCGCHFRLICVSRSISSCDEGAEPPCGHFTYQSSSPEVYETQLLDISFCLEVAFQFRRFQHI
jgi:hypothetical protein